MISILLSSLLYLLLFSSSQQEEFICNGFAGGGSINISLNGYAAIRKAGILQLTNETSRIIGRAFYPHRLRLKNSSFSTAFAFAIVPKYPMLGGHGFAFVLSTTREFPHALPSQYFGLLNSSVEANGTQHFFAVEFDTVQNFEFGDIDDNHIGVDIDSLISLKSESVAYFDKGIWKPLNLNSGNIIQAWIDYDGITKVLDVRISPFSTKPIKPLLSFPVNLERILREEMFVGFSASTGLLSSSQYLLGWSFKINGTAQSLDLFSLPNLSQLTSKAKNKKAIFTAIISSLSAAGVVLAAAAGIFYCCKRAEVVDPWEVEHGPHRFSYDELRRATKSFGDGQLLGFGGFGQVYKGSLPSSAADIAVKRIAHDSRQGIREFAAEIASIGRLRHRNLVQLLGWCRRDKDLLLVYDYMPNGSLDRFLFSDGGSGSSPPRPTLAWAQRFRILRGVAAALLYLHEEWERVVIHRDVKASNVLLDANLEGRLGDFGLAKLQEHGANPGTTRVVGTLGYLAPELTRTGRATTCSDVYAYGALVLEMVCGRRPVEHKAMPEELILVDWVWEQWGRGRWMDVVDARLVCCGYDAAEAEVAVKVGLLCSLPVAAMRPTMREVARYFEVCNGRELPDVPLMPPTSSSFYVANAKERSGEDFVHSYPTSCSEKLSVGSV